MVAANPLAGYVISLEEIGQEGYHYDNSVPGRCDPNSHGLDCSTIVALALNRSGSAVDPCTNSWALAAACKAAPRPAWLTAQFGPDPYTGSATVGLGITKAQAMVLMGVWWFHMTGEGHIETGMGTPTNPGLSFGAHSHASGIGYAHYDDIYEGFFDYFAIPYLLVQWFYVPPAPKVPPMLNLHLAARLHNPDGGWWEAYDNGQVDYLAPDGTIVAGGMTSPADAAAFAGRHVAQLLPRLYGLGKHGFTIVATSGETYVPLAQH